MNRIPWRDNGLLIAFLGTLVFVVLIVAETIFQEIGNQEPVLHFDLLVVSENDGEERDEDVAALSADDAIMARAMLAIIMRQPDSDTDWQTMQQQFSQNQFSENQFSENQFSESRLSQSQHAQISNRIWLEIASSAIQNGYDHSAEEILAHLLTLEPQSLPILFQYAKHASEMNDDSLAIERYQRLLSFHPNHQSSMINLGLVLARQNRHGEVIDVQTQAINASSGTRKAKAYSVRGSSYFELKNYPAAIVDFQSSIEYRPNHPPTWRKLANALMFIDAAEADILQAFNQAIRLQADYLQALHERGRFHWLRGDFSLARRDLEKIKAVAPDYQFARWTLLHLYIDMNKRRSASAEIRWLRKQELDQPEMELIDGLDRWLKNDTANAQPIFAKLVTETPHDNWLQYYYALSEVLGGQTEASNGVLRLEQLVQDPWLKSLARVALAKTYTGFQQHNDAIAVLLQLSEQYPESHYYAYLLGRTYLDADFYLEAASALQRALKLDQGDSQTHLSLAIAYTRAEQFELALKIYEELLALRSNHRPGRYNYALLLERLERIAEAIGQYQQVLSDDPANINAMYRLANLHAKQENYALATTLLNDALAEQPTYHRARGLLADIHFQQTNFDPALEEVNRLLVLQPDSTSAKMLKSDVLRDLSRLAEAADVLATIPTADYSKNTLIKLYNIGKRALDAGDFSLAESCNRSVIAVDRDFDKAWVNLTSALIRSQQYENAVALIENETELLRVNNKLVINLAEAHHLSGHSELAINLLEALQRQDLLSDEGAIVLAASYRAL